MWCRIKDGPCHDVYAEFRPDPDLVVVALGEELDEVGEAIVGGVQGPVLGCDEVYVGRLVGRNLIGAELEALHDRIPHGGVVHAALPGVPDVDESFVPRIPLAVEVLMPRLEAPERLFEQPLRRGGVSGALVDVEYGSRVQRRLDYAACLKVRRGVGALVGPPEVYAGEVVAEAGIEDYLGEKAVVPLTIEEVRELRGSTVLGVVGVAHGNERRVPRPLVRIQAGTRLGVLPVPVEVQNHLGLLNELLVEFVHEVRLL